MVGLGFALSVTLRAPPFAPVASVALLPALATNNSLGCWLYASRPYDVVVILFVGEDSIPPLKLDVFLFGRLIAYPYNVVISFGGSKPPPYVFDNIVFRGKCGRI